MNLVAVATGSTSARLTWDPTQMPSSKFQVYRSLDSNFAHAVTVGGQLPAGTAIYNDYALAPSTSYFYWIRDQNAVLIGPEEITTAAAVVDQIALDEEQMNALYDWAYSVYQGLYPVSWRYIAAPQDLKPKIQLNVTLVRRPGFSDDRRAAGEALVGARIATISVNVSSSPQQPKRALVSVVTVAAGTYTLTVNGNAVSRTYASPPANATQIVEDLEADLAAAGFTAFTYGTDPANESLGFENSDPRADLTLAVTGNLSGSIYRPPKAMTIAQALIASLGDSAFRDPLYAAGIGVGTVEDPRDLSVMLDTEAELRAQFDMFINLANVKAVSGPIIDTVQSLDGTYNQGA